MHWSLLRPNKADETSRNRRHSTIDPTVLQDHNALRKEQPQRQDPHLATKSPSPLRKSFEPASNDGPSKVPEETQDHTIQEHPPRNQRFSILAKRHVSDPQISRTAREHAEILVPPLPAAPSIVTTAPVDTNDTAQSQDSEHSSLPESQKHPGFPPTLTSQSSQQSICDPTNQRSQNAENYTSTNPSARESRITFDEPEKVRLNGPPAYGDEFNSSLALPVSRLSESSRSDGSLCDPVYATTTTHTVSTTTTFFRLPRRKKNKGSLFPLPVKIPPAESFPLAGCTPRASSSGRPLDSPRGLSATRTTLSGTGHHLRDGHSSSALPSPLPSPSRLLEASARRDSTNSLPSSSVSPLTGPPMRFGRGARSKASPRQARDDESSFGAGQPQSVRTSSSTGRTSLGGLLNMSRLRQNSEPHQPRQSNTHPPMPGTPMSTGSKSQSFNIAREPPVIPERQEGDTPAKYLIRLEEAVSRGAVATVLSQSDDDFFKNVLRSYMRGFKFFGDPLDMSTRKLLMEVELPKETQQIDRVLQAFANRYHECNPGVYASPDEAYFIAFSILILHTDVFNKNNKNKMQKQDYTKNARGQGVANEVLECFYDNISYTPFIHVEDDLDINGDRIVTGKLKKSLFTKQSTDSAGRPSREPVDPYTLILDNRLDTLRPSLKDVMDLEEHFTYHGTGGSSNLANLHKCFFKYGILQILSSRSRPEAFTSPETMANPAEAHPGVVDIRVTKVGILWRKDTKKKKTRSPWQEWGAILTGAQLYFFRNSGWVKTLMHQHDSHLKYGSKGTPVVFKPPLEQFKPDVLMSTEDAVALQDTSYKKHKNALVWVRHGGLEEIFLADNESEHNDWLAKLNYAATFRTAGVRIRGLVGNGSDTRKAQVVRRMDSDLTTQSSETSASDYVAHDSLSDSTLAHQIKIARRQIMSQKIAEADERLNEAGNLLDMQLRNARHLQILAPIQNKTREQIVLAAGGMSAKIKWIRIDIWRTKTHRDILAMDLESELKTDSTALSVEEASKPYVPVDSLRGNELPQRQLETPRAKQRNDGDVRPATQPSPSKSLTIDDVFESLHRSSIVSSHKPKASWELPPLSFQPTRTSVKSGSTFAQQHTLAPQASLRSVSDSAKASEISDIAAKLAKPTPSVDNNEQHILKEAGIIEPARPIIDRGDRPETPVPTKEGEPVQSKSPESENGEAKAKLRRSLQRTLRDSTHVPSHHRSKRGKDSASGTLLGDPVSSKLDSEGLTRTTGSFTVHGKKASVINFGSEWQNMTPEERLKLQREAQKDDSKLSVPSAIDDESSSIRSTLNQRPRPVSAVSASTTTSSTTPFEEAAEAAEAPVRDTGVMKDLYQDVPPNAS